MNIRIDASAARAAMRRRANAMLLDAHRAVREGADNAAAIARATRSFHDRSGKTRNTIRSVDRGAFRSAVVANGAAVFLESGTGKYGPKGAPYIIRARNAKALRFVMHGTVYFRQSVIHPGIKPTHFMRDAAEQARPHFVSACIGAMHLAVKR